MKFIILLAKPKNTQLKSLTIEFNFLGVLKNGG